MRISTLQIYDNSTLRIQQGQQTLANTQEQLATGKRLNRPSDDPVATTRILSLNLELSRVQKFGENIDVAERRLRLEETVLGQINTTADRIRELTIQAGDGALGQEDRQIIVNELGQLREEVAALMNTRDAEGQYLFSGAKVSTEPFVKDAQGNFSYQGDDAERFIQVASNFTLPTNDSGREIFYVIDDEIEAKALGPAPEVIQNLTVIDPTEETFQAFSQRTGDLTVSVRPLIGSAAGDYQYSVRDSAGNPVLNDDVPPVALEDIPFDSTDTTADTVTFGGITFDLAGLQAVDSSAYGVTQIDPDSLETGLVAQPTVLNADAYQAYTEANGELKISVAIGTDGAGAAQYSYTITDSANPPNTLDNVTGFTNGATVVLDDGGVPATNMLSFDLSDLSSLSDDQALNVAIGADPNSFINTATVTDPATQDYSDFAAANGDVTVVFQRNGTALEYDLQDGGGASVIGGFQSLPASGEIAVAAMGIDLTVDVAAIGADIPNDTDTTTGVTLTAQVDTVLQGGVDTRIRAEQGQHSLLQTTKDLMDALQAPATTLEEKEARNAAIGRALTELDQAQSGNLQVRTELGARLSALDSSRNINADFTLFTQSALSKLEDLDYAKAISEFSLQETALQAALSSFARVQSLSLFNFL